MACGELVQADEEYGFPYCQADLPLDGPPDRRPCLSLRACLQALRPSPEGTPSEGDRLQHQPVPGVNERRQQGVRRIQRPVDKQLPEVLDLLSVSVRAGLSFDGALRKITDRMTGPLIEEFKRMQQDVRMGSPRARALQAMAKRCDVEDLYLFITAVIQAERLGTSMGRTLNNQADNMRERRRQKAKAEALKAPVKIVFPLVIFIFPAIFVVVLLPSVLSLMHSLGGK